MKISKCMGINKSEYELDFFDYEIKKDTYKFLDPYYISKKEDAFLSECNEYLETFFNRFLFLLNDDEKKAYQLFEHLGEVNEICLGMSSGKPSGRGIGAINTMDIFNAIKNCEAFRNGVAEGIEDVRIFVNGVDKDKTSDMVANIIKYPLIKYTQQQCELYGVNLTEREAGYYWNKDTTRWERGHQKMLVIEGDPYLLFPKNLVSQSKYYCADEYLRMYVLEFLKQYNLENNTHLVHKSYNKDGSVKNAWVTKKDIVKDKESHGEFLTKNWLANFSNNNPTVYKTFRKEIINKISNEEQETLDDQEISEIINGLITALRETPSGGDYATQYHRLMAGILELLFYPSIAHPVVENEINEGRKRIDITFNNKAESGFFSLLANTYDIPCILIMIECKNYSKDLNNPELDQMAGRFSPNRGRFGIICCRNIIDNEKIIKSEQDTVKDHRGWIIHFTDEDIICMLEQKKSGLSVDEYVLKKFIEIVNS